MQTLPWSMLPRDRAGDGVFTWLVPSGKGEWESTGDRGRGEHTVVSASSHGDLWSADWTRKSVTPWVKGPTLLYTHLLNQSQSLVDSSCYSLLNRMVLFWLRAILWETVTVNHEQPIHTALGVHMPGGGVLSRAPTAPIIIVKVIN